VQTQLRDLAPILRQRKIEYFYGDGDADMKAANEAGAVPIRVKRGPRSAAKDVPHYGQSGEVVIKGSEE
jgi:acid phosphatase class B